MGSFLRGALIEYGSGLIGPIPNVVIFQFNPEQLTRAFKPPAKPAGAAARETTQAGDKTVESISFKAHLSAADLLNEGLGASPMAFLARTVGLGPMLAAMEAMIQPPTTPGGLLGAAIDAIGSAISGPSAGGTPPAAPIPREKYPRLLFIWGVTRVLPVTLDSLQITESEFDFLLNPIRAEVDLSLTVAPPDPCADDIVAQGAGSYSCMAKDTLSAANLANTAQQIVELIPF
jgi:hypothetical protein